MIPSCRVWIDRRVVDQQRKSQSFRGWATPHYDMKQMDELPLSCSSLKLKVTQHIFGVSDGSGHLGSISCEFCNGRLLRVKHVENLTVDLIYKMSHAHDNARAIQI